MSDILRDERKTFGKIHSLRKIVLKIIIRIFVPKIMYIIIRVAKIFA